MPTAVHPIVLDDLSDRLKSLKRSTGNDSDGEYDPEDANVVQLLRFFQTLQRLRWSNGIIAVALKALSFGASHLSGTGNTARVLQCLLPAGGQAEQPVIGDLDAFAKQIAESMPMAPTVVVIRGNDRISCIRQCRAFADEAIAKWPSSDAVRTCIDTLLERVAMSPEPPLPPPEAAELQGLLDALSLSRRIDGFHIHVIEAMSLGTIDGALVELERPLLLARKLHTYNKWLNSEGLQNLPDLVKPKVELKLKDSTSWLDTFKTFYFGNSEKTVSASYKYPMDRGGGAEGGKQWADSVEANVSNFRNFLEATAGNLRKVEKMELIKGTKIAEKVQQNVCDSCRVIPEAASP